MDILPSKYLYYININNKLCNWFRCSVVTCNVTYQEQVIQKNWLWYFNNEHEEWKLFFFVINAWINLKIIWILIVLKKIYFDNVGVDTLKRAQLQDFINDTNQIDKNSLSNNE